MSIYFQELEKKWVLTISHSWLWLCHTDSERDRNEPNGNGLLPSTNEVPSVHGGGDWLPSMHYRSHGWGSTSGREVGQTAPPPSDTIGYGQEQGSTHPIGMHSCNCVNVHTSSRQGPWTHFSSEIGIEMMHCHRLSTTCPSPGIYVTCECFPQVRSTYARFTCVGKIQARKISETSTSFLRFHLTTGSKCSVCSLCFQRVWVWNLSECAST